MVFDKTKKTKENVQCERAKKPIKIKLYEKCPNYFDKGNLRLVGEVSPDDECVIEFNSNVIKIKCSFIEFSPYVTCDFPMLFGKDASMHEAIFDKTDYIERQEDYIHCYYNENGKYVYSDKYCIGTKIVKTLTSLECFKELGTIGLIEKEEECIEYLNSKLSFYDWCNKKLFNKMKELQLGNGFIGTFSDLIGTDLERYKAMCDLAKECESNDLLMFLFVKKFGDRKAHYDDFKFLV